MEEAAPTGRAAASASIFRFGPFELDVRAGELRKGASRIRLQDQPLQILCMLLERPGEPVLREEIRQKLWPGDTVVEFDHSINTAVKRLRDALAEPAGKPRYIETLPRRGYRFIGQVETGPELPPAAPPLVVMPPAAKPDNRRWIAAGILGVVITFAVAASWYYRRGAPARWARNVALPEITRRVDAGQEAAVFPLLYKALQVLPYDLALNRLRREISHPFTIRSTPPGASVYLKPYTDPDAPWLYIGQAPLENFMLAMGYYRWRITKPGYHTVEGAGGIQYSNIDFILDAEGSFPAQMVHVPAGNVVTDAGSVHLDDYWMDKDEVTNRQFKEFVDKGGFQDRRYWRQEFVKDGRKLSWEQAMAEFRDSTGRPGPSTWEVGDYPRGREDFPVSGVSWYEALAYAEFAGKQIPTFYHWRRAANPEIYSDVLQFSNFNGTGPARVGSLRGVGSFGTYDLAGNVKEWCWNSFGDRRYILGGAWNESRRHYLIAAALAPFDRSRANGFRCVKYPDGAISDSLTGPVERPNRDYQVEKPVPESVFRILASFYSYDRTELKAVEEPPDERSPYWTAQRITFDAAYDHDRVIAWLFLPRNAKPPYQCVIFAPSGHASGVETIDEAEIKRMEFLMRSGRAVLFPVYKGTFERRPKEPLGPSGQKNQMIQRCKDLQRSVDYLAARPDIEHDRLGFFGVSGNAHTGLYVLPFEPRIRAAVLADMGLPPTRKPPELDDINFAPRVRIPVLMLNGRDDLIDPMETNQLPLLRLLGTPDKDKRHVLFDRGHRGPVQEYVKETLDWFDRYLGAVSTSSAR